MGPRVVGEDFETLVYPVDDGAYYQTTFAYWRQLLAARTTQVGVEPTTSAPSTPTSRSEASKPGSTQPRRSSRTSSGTVSTGSMPRGHRTWCSDVSNEQSTNCRREM